MQPAVIHDLMSLSDSATVRELQLFAIRLESATIAKLRSGVRDSRVARWTG